LFVPTVENHLAARAKQREQVKVVIRELESDDVWD
jgi:hypothetical protein